MTRVLAAIWLLIFAATSAYAQTGTPKPKASLNTELPQQLPDNTSNLISPLNARQVFTDIISSTQSYAAVNAQAGTSYTIVAADYGQLVTLNNSNPVAVTIPGAGSAGFNPFSVFLKNLGAGTVTVTPAIGTIAGGASVQMTQNQGLFIVSDGTNWQTWFGSGGSGGLTLPVTVPNGGTGQTTLTNHGVLVGAGTSAVTQLAAGGVGTVLIGQGASADPAFSAMPNVAAIGIGSTAAATGVALFNTPVTPGGSGQGAIGATGTNGAVLLGQGGTNDVQVQNKTASPVCSVPTGTQTWACNTLTLTNALAIVQGGTGATTGAAAFGNLAPTPTRAGDVIYWNGSSWTTLAGNNSGTQVLQENSSGVPSWGSVAGTGTVTSVNILGSVGLTVTGTCNSTTAISCTVKQALNNAVTQASPSNPPTTSNTVAFTMGGLGGVCAITPIYSTRIIAFFNGLVTNTSAGDGLELRIQYGTGVAPTGGAASTGTAIGATTGVTAVGLGSASTAFSAAAAITGLTAGTAYWVDLGQIAVGGGLGAASNIGCSLVEF